MLEKPDAAGVQQNHVGRSEPFAVTRSMSRSPSRSRGRKRVAPSPMSPKRHWSWSPAIRLLGFAGSATPL